MRARATFFSLSLLFSLALAGCGRTTNDAGATNGGDGGTNDGGKPVTGVTSKQPTYVRTRTVDKLDLLLAIDNSASMGDKQELLADAVPDLLDRLLTPNCVDETSGTPTGQRAIGGICPVGSRPEFAPVQDLHVGIVSSSLGGRGGDQCIPGPDDHNDDRGHLLNRAHKVETVVGNALPENFLAWLPQSDANTGKPRDRDVVGATPYAASQLDQMKGDFADLIVGVKENGCGYEAQLESVYRFLIQPDPYLQLVKSGNNGPVSYDGYDFELLQQRAAFLRPDSIVSIVMVTDENESTVAPTAFGGRAWFFEDQKNVRPGTAACQNDPNDPSCGSCYLQPNAGDPGCAQQLDATTDHPNVRFFHMKQRFGVDPRFPLERYTRGFSMAQVPDRNSEYDGFDYIGNAPQIAKAHFCRNPLFAAQLPKDQGEELCNLPAGPRTPDLVYFTIIGGVPWQLLTNQPDDLSANYNDREFKSRLTDADYTRLLGKDPLHYQFDGIHPLMQESITPRAGVGADQAHDREWDTRNKDLQYACTFELPTPKNCASTDPLVKAGCDCDQATDSPLCQGTTQSRGKAYPTVNELAVARSLGDQAIVASICPAEPKNKTSELYGYRPAVRSIVERMKSGLGPACLPEPLPHDGTGATTCNLIVEVVGGDCASRGYESADANTTAEYKQRLQAELGSGADAIAICRIPQIPKSDFVDGGCDRVERAGFCYGPSGTCAQAIRFSARGNPVGSRVSLQCPSN